MVSKTNSSEYGATVRAEHDDDRRGTHLRTSAGFVPRSSGAITPKYHRGPPRKPVTSKNQTRPRPEDITGIAGPIDPNDDLHRILDSQVKLGLQMTQEVKAGLAGRDGVDDLPVQQARAILGSRARTIGNVLLVRSQDTPKPTPEA